MSYLTGFLIGVALATAITAFTLGRAYDRAITDLEQEIEDEAAYADLNATVAVDYQAALERIVDMRTDNMAHIGKRMSDVAYEALND